MKLTTRDGKLRLRSAFKLMFLAYVFSMGIFSLLMLLLFALIIIIGAPIETDTGTVQGAEAALSFIPLLIVTPLTIILYAGILAGLGAFGLLIYRIFWPLRIDGAIGNTVFE